jgi:copper chaperone CopZ
MKFDSRGDAMKKTIVLSLLLISAAFFCMKRPDAAKSLPLAHATVSLPTLRCTTCVETIQSALAKAPGVQSVTVDLKAKTARVAFDSLKTSLPKIEKAIAAIGYDANQTKRDEKAHAGLPGCCQ